jgi:Kef-type K+ transport system membrane component KefB
MVLTVLFVILAVALALALAYVPMRLLLWQMARNVKAFIQRQRERRRVARDTPDRRKAIT